MNKELFFTSKWNNDNTSNNTIILHLQAKAKYKLRKTNKSKKTYRAQSDGVGGGGGPIKSNACRGWSP